ncbi:ABC transporter substrate-binding protein [Roseomonas sp. NAR14]|uniref:ABC transporter substrate-binding protein n=1 Tax=Roseomonas acroporae TaxID=2937791 RepID=A0A9X1YBT8_9PROT|nr:ABC transporter substrate-binding protein [Roseomonas acroporae]MCK8783616.1 ABC transporter substrate-binding protein [Roseomonas acroporae]
MPTVPRRSLILGAGAAALPRFAPRVAIAQPAAARVLRYVPQADVTILDPVMTTAYITRTHALMVYDQLYGLDGQLRPQPQMAEGHTVEDDGKRVTIRLREGLKFHDGEKVLARDCVASVKRWAQRDPLGQALLARLDEMAATGDREFTIRLKRPFGPLLQALAKLGPPACCIMPARLAETDAFRPVTEVVGSGPFRWLANERVAGARVAYARNPDYVPRPDGTPDWAAGPKLVHFDRVEWNVIPDPGTAAAAIQNGEVDWWENPPNDLLPVLARNRQVVLENIITLGVMGTGIFNTLHPPFDKAAVRRAVLGAVSQADFMTAVAGTEPGRWRDRVGVFTPGSPMANDAGMEILTAPRDIEASRRALREAGYRGEKVVLLAASDQSALAALGEVGNDLLRRLGMNVEYVVTDWGSVVQRRASKAPPEQGGWSMFHTTWAGLDMVNPAVTQVLRANGERAYFGWPDLPGLEALRDRWLEAPEAEQPALAAAIQAEALKQAVFLPTGQYFYQTAYRRGLTGLSRGAFLFWNIRRG